MQLTKNSLAPAPPHLFSASLKNFSLIETLPGSQTYKLSPAYDMLPVNIVSEDREETALALNGRKTKLRRKDFLALAAVCELSPVAAERLLRRLIERVDGLITVAAVAVVPEDIRERCIELIRERAHILE